MKLRDALVKLGYDMDKMVQPPLYGGALRREPLTPDSDISECGIKLSEKLCTPGCGCFAVVVEIQRADDWGMGRPWCCFYFVESESKLNACEWSFETRWYKPEDIERLR